MRHIFRQRKQDKGMISASSAVEAERRPAARSAASRVLTSAVASSRPLQSVPDSGSMSVQNSKGASAAALELAKNLDSLLSDFNLSDDFGAKRRQLEEKLNRRAEEYCNARLNEHDDAQPWSHTATDLTILTAAIKCSVAVYGSSVKPDDEKLCFELIHDIPPSMSGVIKATTFTKVTQISTQPLVDEGFPALVVAVRGSSKPIDWVVNANYEPHEAQDLFDGANWLPKMETHEKFQVHSGFWNGAIALLSAVKVQLQSVADSKLASHVIFTGHSAGGAVASLLYLHVLGVARQLYPSLRFSLVTFGSPPVTNPSITSLLNQHLKLQNNPGLAVSVVNETDVVTRVDCEYIKSLLDLYDSVGGTEIPRECWKLPPPALHPIGSIVVLKEIGEDSDEPQVGAFSVSDEEFAKLLFCNAKAHRKDFYQKCVSRLKPSERASG